MVCWAAGCEAARADRLASRYRPSRRRLRWAFDSRVHTHRECDEPEAQQPARSFASAEGRLIPGPPRPALHLRTGPGTLAVHQDDDSARRSPDHLGPIPGRFGRYS